MQVTIDIPEPRYDRLALQATAACVTLETLVLDGAARLVSDSQGEQPLPRKQTLVSMNMNMNEFAIMTAEEMEAFEEAFAIDPEGAVQRFGLEKLTGSDAG